MICQIRRRGIFLQLPEPQNLVRHGWNMGESLSCSKEASPPPRMINNRFGCVCAREEEGRRKKRVGVRRFIRVTALAIISTRERDACEKFSDLSRSKQREREEKLAQFRETTQMRMVLLSPPLLTGNNFRPTSFLGRGGWRAPLPSKV